MNDPFKAIAELSDLLDKSINENVGKKPTIEEQKKALLEFAGRPVSYPINSFLRRTKTYGNRYKHPDDNHTALLIECFEQRTDPSDSEAVITGRIALCCEKIGDQAVMVYCVDLRYYELDQ